MHGAKRQARTLFRFSTPISMLALAGSCLVACTREAPEANAEPAIEPVAEVATAPAPAPAAVASGLPFDTLAAQMFERMSVQPGERVLLIGAPGRFDPLVERLRAGVIDDGGTDLGAVGVGTGAAPEEWATDFTRSLDGLSGDALQQALANVDLGIMMPGAAPTDAPYAALQGVLNTGHGRTVHFHWRGAYTLDGAEFPADEGVDAVYIRALAETDYAKLAALEQEFETALRSAETRVTTPAGTDLRFRIGDRPVNRQDGEATAARANQGRILIDREIELPAGAIRVAPIEESVHGTIAFPPSVWGGVTVEGLMLTIESGRVTDIQAATGLEAVLAEVDAAGPAGRAFREFVVGFNPLLAMQQEEGRTWIPYFGYGAGVVRLSLGDNSELGGAVTGGYVRWNFFTDATVTVGDEVWVRDGVLVR